MPIDINGAFTISGTGGGRVFKITGNQDVLTIDSQGRTFYPGQVGFIAGCNIDNGWTALAGAAWTRMTMYNNVSLNVGGGYSASRFTAPVVGTYLFHFVSYNYKPSATAGHYLHPMFWINGGTQPTTYRTRSLHTPTGYTLESEIADIFYLNAGDYVDTYLYAAAAGISYYQYYTQFAGYLVG